MSATNRVKILMSQSPTTTVTLGLLKVDTSYLKHLARAYKFITHSLTLATTFMPLVIQVIRGKETILFVLEAPLTLQSPTLTKPNIAAVLYKTFSRFGFPTQ